MADYLPPVVVSVTGDLTAFLSDMAQVKAVLTDLGKTQTDVPVGADLKALATDLAAAKTQIDNTEGDVKIGGDDAALLAAIAKARVALLGLANQSNRIHLGADTSSYWTQIESLKGLLASDPAELDLKMDIKPALAEIAELKGALALENLDRLSTPLSLRPQLDVTRLAAVNAALATWSDAHQIHLEVTPDLNQAALAGIEAELAVLRTQTAIGALEKTLDGETAAAVAASSKGGKGGGLGAVLATLLTGGGGIGGLAAGGSLLSFAGLGIDHVIFTAASLAGSAVGAALGGGLLALGAGGVAGVGFGTNLAGIGQAAGDIKNVLSAMNNLSAAQSTYGAGSKEAIDAFNQLTAAETAFSPVARASVVAAANAIQGFKTMFDQYTGQAENLGAQIITMFVKGGEAYLPSIGKFAAENMKILLKGLQPLVTWLDGPGLKIFDQLERQFSKQLPTGVSAFVNAIESLFKIIGDVAPKTGGFLTSLNNFFTGLNTQLSNPRSKDSSDINSLIADFRTWAAFVKEAYRVVRDLFKDDKSHTSTTIIKTLTGFLTELDNFEKSLAGQKDIGNLFAVHKKEILAILNTLPPLAKAFAGLYGALAPALVTVVTGGLNALAKALIAIEKVKIGNLQLGALAIGLGLVAAKLGLLSGVVGPLVKNLATLALGGLAKLFEGTALGTAFSKLILKLNPVSASAGLVTAGTELSGAAKLLSDAAVKLGAEATAGTGGEVAGGAAGAAAGAERTFASSVVSFAAKVVVFAAAAALIYKLADFIAPTSTKQDVAQLKNPFGVASTGSLSVAGLTTAENKALQQEIQLAISQGLSITPALMALFIKNAKDLGSNVAQGLADGIKGGSTVVTRSAADLGNSALGSVRDVLKSKSPSQEMVSVGKDFVAGFSLGITDSTASLSKSVTALAKTAVTDAVTYLESSGVKALSAAGVSLMQGLAAGIRAGGSGVQSAIVSSITGGSGAGGGGQVNHFNVTIQISAPGGNPQAIKNAVEGDSAIKFAKAAVVALKSGAGTQY